MEKNITAHFFLIFLLFSLFLFLPEAFAISGTSSDGSIFVTSTTFSAGLVAGTSSDSSPGRTSVGGAGLSATYTSDTTVVTGGAFGPDVSVEDTATPAPVSTTTTSTTTDSGSSGGGGGLNSIPESSGEESAEEEEQTEETPQEETEEQTSETSDAETESEKQEEDGTVAAESTVTLQTQRVTKLLQDAVASIKNNKETVLGVLVGTALIGTAFYYKYRKKMKRKAFLDYFSKGK